MNSRRVAKLCCVLLLVSVTSVTMLGCSSSGPEAVWRSYVRASEAKDGDGAVSYWDYETRERLGADSGVPDDLVMDLATAVEDLQREYVEAGMGRDFEGWGGPSSVDIDGDNATLHFDVEGVEYTVDMQLIDGAWKIINVNTPEGPRPQ